MSKVAKALETKFGEPRKASLVWRPQNTVAVDDEQGERLLKLIENLNEHDDVQNVYANYGGSSGAGTQSGTASPQAVANQTQSHQQAQSLFVASCPPWSKPLLEPGTGLGRSCSTWVRCPQGFTCYSNFPDGRNAHCCTTVPLDNQVVFRANTALALQADITGQQQQHQGLTVGQQSNNNPFGPQFAPSRAVANDSTENLGTTANGNAGANSTDTFGPHFAKCPASMVNIGGFCKRS